MKYILKITSVNKTELKLESGKNTFTMPATSDAIKKAKTAMRKGSNLSITIDGENSQVDVIKFGTSSGKPTIHSKVPKELEKYCKENLPEMVLGAGSISDATMADMYISMGANFIVGPLTKEDRVPSKASL